MDKDFLERRTDELCGRVMKTGLSMHTNFLDPADAEIAEACLKRHGELKNVFWGGFEDAERRCAVIYPSGTEPDLSFISVVGIRLNGKFQTLAHRDVFGSLMSLQIEREMTGDVLAGEENAFIFIMNSLCDYVLLNLVKIGGQTVKPFLADLHDTTLPLPKMEYYRRTVSSYRLDCVIAGAYDLSRSDSAAAIAKGLVKLNHVAVLKSDTKVKPGDLLSLKQHGRVLFIEERGCTAKGRFNIYLGRYI